MKQRLSLPPFPFRGREMEGCPFYAPLWHEKLRGSPFLSLDPNHHVCTVTQAVWTPPYGYVFDGTDDIISIADNDALDITGTLWIEMWLKTVADEDGATILNKGGTTPSFFFNQYGAERVDMRAYDVDGGNDRWITSSGATPNVFFMLDFVSIQNANPQGYVNGVSNGAVDAIRANKALRVNTAALILGGITVFSNCTIGEVRIYNRAPGAGEILHNLQSTKWRYQ